VLGLPELGSSRKQNSDVVGCLLWVFGSISLKHPPSWEQSPREGINHHSSSITKYRTLSGWLLFIPLNGRNREAGQPYGSSFADLRELAACGWKMRR